MSRKNAAAFSGLGLLLSLSLITIPASSASSPESLGIPIPVYNNSASNVPTPFSRQAVSEIAASDNSQVIAHVPVNANYVAIKNIQNGQRPTATIGDALICADEIPETNVKQLQISGDGNRIAFLSKSMNVTCAERVASKGKLPWKAWVSTYDSLSDAWVTVAISKTQGSGTTYEASSLSMSHDGKRAVFISASDEIYPGDSNRSSDVFAKDLQTGEVTLISLGAGGWQNAGSVRKAFISKDGNFAAWEANYYAADTPVYPLETGSATNIMMAHLDPNGDGIVNDINVAQVAIPGAKKSDLSLQGIVESSTGPALMMNSGSSDASSTYLYSIQQGQLLEINGERLSLISSARNNAASKFSSYSLDNYQNILKTQLPSVKNEDSVYALNNERVFFSSSKLPYEQGLASLPSGTSAAQNLSTRGVQWVSANPRNIIPSEVERGRLNEQVVWLASLNGQLGKLIHQKKYERGDKNVTKPSSTISEASLPADRRTTVLDIDDLETLRAETEATLTSAREKKELIDLALTAAACKNPGQWCGATKAAATSEISSALLDVMVNKIAGKFPLVQAFDLAYNSANGACPGPLEQIVNYSAAAAAESHIGTIRSNGEAASWPVTQNILEDYYGIDRPGCWDQVGLDADTLLDAAGGFAEGLGGKWKGLGASITAVQISVNSM